MSAIGHVRQTLNDLQKGAFSDVSPGDVERAMGLERIDMRALTALLSPAAAGYLEPMARQAHAVARKQFGNAVQLFTPLYISNFCENACVYCSFARQYHIDRRHLELPEIRLECERIAAGGMRHILLLTGEARRLCPPEYIRDAAAVAGEWFSSIGIEIYPMSVAEYELAVEAGVDALTIYQEVYDESRYAEFHAGGPKSDYEFRLDAPERACKAGVRAVTLGPLLGLGEPRAEILAAAVHLQYLQREYPGVEFSLSLPRMRPLVSGFQAPYTVDDRLFVQFLTALRIAFPTVGMTLSTRENAAFRDAVLPMGVTRLSAGVSTAVGGRADGQESTAQFEIADTRSVDQMRSDLLRMGYQPVMHDWHHAMLRPG